MKLTCVYATLNQTLWYARLPSNGYKSNSLTKNIKARTIDMQKHSRLHLTK